MIDLDVSAEDEILKHLAEAEGDDCRAPLMHAVVMKLQANGPYCTEHQTWRDDRPARGLGCARWHPRTESPDD